MKNTREILLEHARDLRKNSTKAEQYLWYFLRGHRLNGYKFKRQVPGGQYIVDFVCQQKKLIIELDGEPHQMQRQYDHDRTIYLNLIGYKVLRYWNHDVFQKINDILDAIFIALED